MFIDRLIGLVSTLAFAAGLGLHIHAIPLCVIVPVNHHHLGLALHAERVGGAREPVRVGSRGSAVGRGRGAGAVALLACLRREPGVKLVGPGGLCHFQTAAPFG